MPPSFDERLEAARKIEIAASDWLRSRDWYVVPTYDFSGKGDDKAPKLMAPTGLEDLVLPDLHCFRNGAGQWLEVKWKSHADLYRKTGTLETGISKRLWRHYSSVEGATGDEAFIAFVHEREAEVRGASIIDLSAVVTHVYDGDKMGRGGMVFFDYLRIPRWCSLAELLARRAA